MRNHPYNVPSNINIKSNGLIRLSVDFKRALEKYIILTNYY